MQWEKDLGDSFLEAFSKKGTAISYILDSLPEIVVLTNDELSIELINDAGI